MIQCLHWGRGLIPTPGVYSAAIPLGKGFTYIIQSPQMGLKTGGSVSVHTRKIPSCFSKKSCLLWRRACERERERERETLICYNTPEKSIRKRYSKVKDKKKVSVLKGTYGV